MHAPLVSPRHCVKGNLVVLIEVAWYIALCDESWEYYLVDNGDRKGGSGPTRTWTAAAYESRSMADCISVSDAG